MFIVLCTTGSYTVLLHSLFRFIKAYIKNCCVDKLVYSAFSQHFLLSSAHNMRKINSLLRCYIALQPVNMGAKIYVIRAQCETGLSQHHCIKSAALYCSMMEQIKSV